MKVLIISTNRERSPFPVAPLGALVVAAAAEDAGHEVQLLDLMFSRTPGLAVRAALRRERPDVVGVSVRNLDSCVAGDTTHYYKEVAAVVQQVRRRCDAPVVLGGGGFSVTPDAWLRRLDACCGVVGEGEQALPLVLERLASGGSLAGLPGVALRDEPAAATPLLDGEAVSVPAHHLCAYEPYIRAGGWVGVQTKRGCAYRCVYCTYPALEGGGWRLRAPERVVEEVARAAAAHRFVYFTDGVFNAPREHALQVCRLLARRCPGLGWMAYCNPVGLDDELARAMVDAGCLGVELGLDAVLPHTLQSARKPFGPEQIEASMAALHAAELPFAAFILFGLPGERRVDLERTQAFLDDCAPANAVFVSTGVRVYPGTAMERAARDEGAISASADLFEPTFFVSPELGPRPAQLMDELAARRAAWTTPTDWRRARLRLVQTMCNRLGQRPQWKNVSFYGKHLR